MAGLAGSENDEEKVVRRIHRRGGQTDLDPLESRKSECHGCGGGRGCASVSRRKSLPRAYLQLELGLLRCRLVPLKEELATNIHTHTHTHTEKINRERVESRNEKVRKRRE